MKQFLLSATLFFVALSSSLLLTGCDFGCTEWGFGSPGPSSQVVPSQPIEPFSLAVGDSLALEMNRYWNLNGSTGGACSEPVSGPVQEPISWASASSPSVEVRTNGKKLLVRALAPGAATTVRVASLNVGCGTAPRCWKSLSTPIQFSVLPGGSTDRSSDVSFGGRPPVYLSRITHTPTRFSNGDTVTIHVEALRGGERFVPNPNSRGDFSWVIPEGVQYVSGRADTENPLQIASDTLVVIARSEEPIVGMVRHGLGFYGQGLGFHIVSGSASPSNRNDP